MNGEGIASRYAKALFELGLEEKNYKRLMKDLETFNGAYSQSEDLRMVLQTPSIRHEQRKEVLKLVMTSLKLGALTSNFINLLVDKDRVSLVPEIFNAFQRFVDNEEGIVRADVVSAKPLNSSQKLKVKQTLGKVTGKKVELTVSTDAEIIGGIIARIGGVVYDGSLKNQLRSLRQAVSTQV